MGLPFLILDLDLVLAAAYGIPSFDLRSLYSIGPKIIAPGLFFESN